MKDHGHEAHEGQVAVVAHERHTLSLHEVTAEAAELCVRVFSFQGCNEMRGVEVATGLAGDEVVVHG